MSKVTKTAKTAVKATSLTPEAIKALTRIGRNQAWFGEVFEQVFSNAFEYSEAHGIAWSAKELKKINEFKNHSKYILSVAARYNWNEPVLILTETDVRGIIDACDAYRVFLKDGTYDNSLFQQLVEISAFTANKAEYWEMDTNEAIKFLTFRDQWLFFVSRVVNNF